MRAGVPGYTARTQSSIAVIAGEHKPVLINASPDIRTQTLALTSRPEAGSGPLRDSIFSAVILLDAQIDHVSGLLLLRESPQPLKVYCTREVRSELTGPFAILQMLDRYCGVEWHEIPLDGSEFRIEGMEEAAFRAVPLISNAPPYSERRDRPAPGDNIGLVVRDTATQRQAFYAPGLGIIDETVRSEFAAAHCLLVDGTCWQDDDMARAGVSTKTARAMGHLPQCGPDGMLAVLADHSQARRILIHINNTNPILNDRGPERRLLEQQGIEVAYDGQVIEI